MLGTSRILIGLCPEIWGNKNPYSAQHNDLICISWEGRVFIGLILQTVMSSKLCIMISFQLHFSFLSSDQITKACTSTLYRRLCCRDTQISITGSYHSFHTEVTCIFIYSFIYILSTYHLFIYVFIYYLLSIYATSFCVMSSKVVCELGLWYRLKPLPFNYWSMFSFNQQSYLQTSTY